MKSCDIILLPANAKIRSAADQEQLHFVQALFNTVSGRKAEINKKQHTLFCNHYINK